MAVTGIFCRLFSVNIGQTVRKLHSSSIIWKGAYDGDGKTMMSILNKDLSYGLMIDSYSQMGFRLNNGFGIVGPIAIFPRAVLSWKVGGVDDINDATLSLFTVLEPKLDVLVIGIGSDKRSSKLDKMIIEYSKKHKINMEVVPTNQACGIFNYLNAEGRFVGAGIIPPEAFLYDTSTDVSDPRNLKVLDSTHEIV